MGLFDMLAPKVKPNFSFVCTGNICRSAYADLLLRSEVAQKQLPVTVSSAGTQAMVGCDIDPVLGKVAREEGIYRPHMAQLLTEELISQQFGFILAMTKEHQERVLALYPAASKRTFLLSELASISRRISEKQKNQELNWAGMPELFLQEKRQLAPEENYDIDDPYKLPEEEQHKIAYEIKTCVQDIVKLLAKVKY